MTQLKSWLGRSAVLAEYAAIYYWLIWLPLHTPHFGCFDFRFVSYFLGGWLLFWCAAICLPAAIFALDLKGEVQSKFRRRMWLAAGYSAAIFAIGIPLLFGPVLMFLPYLSALKEAKTLWREADFEHSLIWLPRNSKHLNGQPSRDDRPLASGKGEPHHA